MGEIASLTMSFSLHHWKKGMGGTVFFSYGIAKTVKNEKNRLTIENALRHLEDLEKHQEQTETPPLCPLSIFSLQDLNIYCLMSCHSQPLESM